MFKSANEKIQGIGDTHISQVTELVDKAKDGFATLNGAVDAAEKVAPSFRRCSAPTARRATTLCTP